MMKKQSKRIRIEFEDNVIEVPRGWEHISLSDYENFCMSKPETRLELIQYVADVCKVDVNIFLDAPRELFEDVYNAIKFIFDTDFKECSTIEIDKEKYTISSSDKLTLGEWVDIEAVLASESKTKLAEILAIICRPRGEEYNIDLTEKRKDLFKNLSCDKALPLISFFLLKEKRSKEILSRSLMVMEGAALFLQDIKTFPLNGVGIKRLPIWQRIKYYYLTISLGKQLSKCLDFFSTNPTKQKQKRISINLKNR